LFTSLLSRQSDPSDRDAIGLKLRSLAEAMGAEPFKRRIAGEMIRRLAPADIIPGVYEAYRPIVEDGLFFFLSHLSLNRVVDLAADQLRMPVETCREQRLLELAKKCPTLHKLGQIIARNQNLDAEVRRWFISLENGHYGTDPETVLPRIRRAVQPEEQLFSIALDSAILSEASVGAVCPFKWRDPETGEVQRGVCKIVKPGIRALLDEELQVLDELAVFFQARAESYPLEAFRYTDVFRDIRQALAEEVNLLGEQRHLWDAWRFYEHLPNVRIPQLAPFSNRSVTAMSHMDGEKITDAPLSASERRACATLLFNTLILKPLLSGQEESIFHGDPHAGNILVGQGQTDGGLWISLVDWSLAGRLTKHLRIKLFQLLQSIATGSVDLVVLALKGLSVRETSDETVTHTLLRKPVAELMSSPAYTSVNLLDRVFRLVDCAARNAVVFGSDLLLFRKALFTLEGIVVELDPQFNVDEAIAAYIRTALMGKLPARLQHWLSPLADVTEHLVKQMSCQDLQQLLMGCALSGIKSGASKVLAVRHFFGSPHMGGICEPVAASL
jgi:ubiquinone biosynthesis protein